MFRHGRRIDLRVDRTRTARVARALAATGWANVQRHGADFDATVRLTSALRPTAGGGALGSIVNVASVAGRRPAPPLGSYAAASSRVVDGPGSAPRGVRPTSPAAGSPRRRAIPPTVWIHRGALLRAGEVRRRGGLRAWQQRERRGPRPTVRRARAASPPGSRDNALGGRRRRAPTHVRRGSRHPASGIDWPGGHDAAYWHAHYGSVPAVLRGSARALLSVG